MHRRLSLLILAAWAIAAAAGPAFGQVARSHEVLTIADTAVGLASATRIVDGASMTVCAGTLEGGPIRFLYHGATPTATTGEPLAVGDRITIEGARNLAQFRAIRTTAVSGVIRFTCGRVTTLRGDVTVTRGATVAVSGVVATTPDATVVTEDWTSSAGQTATVAVTVGAGWLRQVTLTPSSGGTAPTALYDVTLTTAAGTDLLSGSGADNSATIAKIIQVDGIYLEAGTVTINVSNAGASKAGTVTLVIQ